MAPSVLAQTKEWMLVSFTDVVVLEDDPILKGKWKLLSSVFYYVEVEVPWRDVK